MPRRYTGGFLSAKEQATDANTANGIFTTQEAGALTTAGNFPTGRWTPSRSLRFRATATQYLNRTQVAGNTGVFTLSFWVKRGSKIAGDEYILTGQTPTGGRQTTLSFTSAGILNFGIDSAVSGQATTTAVFRDPSAWYHIVLTYNSSRLAGQRAQIHVNGSGNLFTSDNTAGTSYWNTAGYTMEFGRNYGGGFSRDIDGYYTEVNYIDGQALTPSSFGQTDPQTGAWVPKRYAGTYGTNGFYLDFRNASNTSSLGQDSAFIDGLKAENNFFTTNNFSVTPGVTYDSMVDVPGIASVSSQQDIGGVQRGNYCTWNPLDIGGGSITLSNGNLSYTVSSGAGSQIRGTIGTDTSSKWYWEFTNGTNAGPSTPVVFGISTLDGNITNNTSSLRLAAQIYTDAGSNFTANRYINGVGTSITTQFRSAAIGDIFQVAYDAATGNVWFGKNNTWYDGVNSTTGNPSIGANPVFTLPIGSPMTPLLVNLGASYSGALNCGQRAFAYTPPIGFKSLNTTNLPNPIIKRPNDHFDVKTWTGNGTGLTVGTTAKQTSAYQINDSVRFKKDYSTYLTRTPTVTGSQTTWTASMWIKRGLVTYAGSGGVTTMFGWSAINAGQSGILGFANSSLTGVGDNLAFSTGGSNFRVTNKVINDTSSPAWYHCVFVWDSTNANDSLRARIYVNGVLQTYSLANSITQNTTLTLNVAGYPIAIGADIPNGGAARNFFDGYITEVNFIDGQALEPSNFGVFDANNNWMPQRYTGTHGTNGFYLPMNQTGATGFNAVTYTGNAGKNRVISGVGFSPDLAIIKCRSTGRTWGFWDSIRGATKYLASNNLDAEVTDATNGIQSFTNDGFTIGSVGTFNANNDNYVAWCWKAGDTTVSNTSGAITSSVRANPATGVSVVTYTGNGVAGATVGHGLGVTPAMVIIKNRSAVHSWHVITAATTQSVGSSLTNTTFNLGSKTGGVLQLNTTTAYAGYGMDPQTNANADNYVAYCFSEIAGFSKFGTYTGNGSSTGPTITLGFRPAFVMIKRTDTNGNWVMFDSVRSTINTRSNIVSFDLADREYGTADGVGGIDFSSTGFQLRDTHTTRNATSGNYIYMAFADTTANAFWKDNSTNTNSFQPSQSIGTASDIMLDSPTDTVDSNGNIVGNYAILNSAENVNSTYLSFQNANLRANMGTGAGTMAWANMVIPNGKWYWENTVVALSNGTSLGISYGANTNSDGNAKSITYDYVGNKRILTVDTAYGATYTAGDVIGVAVDREASTVTFYKNGVSQGAISDVTISTQNYRPFIHNNSSSAGGLYDINFGQTPFSYASPTGFKTLNTKNLKDVGASNLPDTFGNFVNTPDLVWIKSRTSGVYRWQWLDTVRGPKNALFSSDAEAQQSFDSVQSFIPNGVTLGTEVGTNASGNSHSGYFWNRGKTPGFDIVNYGGSGVARSVQHSLGDVPKMMIVKQISTGSNSWFVYHASVGPGSWTALNLTNVATSDTTVWNNTAPSSSEFTLGTNTAGNGASNSYIAYLWVEVPGYSKFGSYVGNGSTDGTFIYTGFQPEFVMYKCTTAVGSWILSDAEANKTNPTTTHLRPNTTGAADNGTNEALDILSNGFKHRGVSNNNANSNGQNYIYMAFAKTPFKYANAR